MVKYFETTSLRPYTSTVVHKKSTNIRMPLQPNASDLATTAAVQYKIDLTSLLPILLNFSNTSLILSALSVLPAQSVLGDHYTYGLKLFDDFRGGLYTQPSTDESRLLLKLFDDSRGTLYTQLSTDESRLLLLHHGNQQCNI